MHNLLAGAKVSALVVFIALGFGWGSGSFGQPDRLARRRQSGHGWLLAMVPIMFTYSGWNAAAYVAEEIKNPSRNVPLALGLGTIGVVVIYIALNVLYLYAMPIGDLAGLSGRLTDVVAEHLFGFVAGNVIAIFTIVSIAASISAMVMAGPRVYYAMARDHMFLEAAAKVHPKYRTPILAIFAQAAWSSILVLSGGLATARRLHRLRRRVVLRVCGGVGVHAAPARAARAPAVQGARLSAGAGLLRGGERADGACRELQTSTQSALAGLA